jgi:hypothetical protein
MRLSLPNVFAVQSVGGGGDRWEILELTDDGFERPRLRHQIISIVDSPGKYSNVIHVPSAELRKHFAGSIQLFVNGMNV